jgi:dolichyl-phosphate-mannose-protein mannosyltransferase
VTILARWFLKQPDHSTRETDPESSKGRLRKLLVQCLLISFLALGVRLLTWQDLHLEVWRVQTYVTSDYKDSAYQFLKGDLRAFVSDINHMEHPPGYPILLAGLFKVFGDSDNAIQFVQMVCDAIATVMVFLIALELLPSTVALIAGLLAALSPQFAYYSVLLLPDSLSVLPVLLAVYLIVHARRHPSLLNFAAAGALVGISCWLRANALLLAPFLAAITPVVAERGKRLRTSAAILFGATLVIAPVTIKNAIVFRHFIPLSLGVGQTLLEGIAEYDEEGRFKIPKTDLGIMRQEAEWNHRPEYALMLFSPDGIERDRMRIARGLRVIGTHPVWFLGVMSRRATSSMRLDRVPVVSSDAPVSHVYESTDQIQPVWSSAPAELIAAGNIASQRAAANLVDNGQRLRLVADETKYGGQIVSGSIAVKKHTDYLFRLPLKLEEGRALIKITNEDQSTVLASRGIDLVEGVPPREQPLVQTSIPLVSANNSAVHFVFANNASAPVRPVAQLGRIEMFELGPSSYKWMRYLRMPIAVLQRSFLTACVLPLAIIGMVLLIRARYTYALVMLLVVPAYYLLVQSALHTERRYVFVIQYFFLGLAAITLWWFFGLLKSGVLTGYHLLQNR